VAKIADGVFISEPRQSCSHRLLTYIRLSLIEARPIVQVVFLLRFVTGAFFAARSHSGDPVRTAAGLVAWWLAVVFAYLLNGVMDVDEDRSNGSGRPIARGELPERTAGAITVLAGLGSLAITVAFVPGATPWIATFLLLGLLYSASPFPAKRWSSTCALSVFGLGWATFAGGAAAAGGSLGRTGFVFAAVMSAWMALVGAVVKDLSDLDGDAAGGRRTVAVRHGAGRVRLLGAAGALLIGAAAIAVPAAWAPEALFGTAPVVVGAVCVVVQIVRTSRIERADKRTRRSAYRVFMRTQYAANLAMMTGLATGLATGLMAR
jgi:4-hydroxybenzoate polyprenyltransferase